MAAANPSSTRRTCPSKAAACRSPAAECQQKKEQSRENVSRQAHRLHAVGFRQLQEFVNREQSDDGRDDRQHRHRRAQDEHQHNRNQYDRGRDAFEQGKWCLRRYDLGMNSNFSPADESRRNAVFLGILCQLIALGACLSP